ESASRRSRWTMPRAPAKHNAGSSADRTARIAPLQQTECPTACKGSTAATFPGERRERLASGMDKRRSQDRRCWCAEPRLREERREQTVENQKRSPPETELSL